MVTYNIFDLNRHELTVTPESVVVVPGGTSTLRIRSNCAWCITTRPELALVDRICGFGDGSVTISAPEDASIDGEIVFATDNESITQKIVISSVEPELVEESTESSSGEQSS